MRNPIIYSLFVLSMFFITSCGVDEELLPFAGEWRLDSSSGGFGGGGFPINADIRMIIEGDDLIYNVDGYTSFIANLCLEEEKYYDVIVFDKKHVQDPGEGWFSLSDRMIYYISEESLTLSNICNDCLSYHFVRI